MIKVEKIRPLNSDKKIGLSTIEDDYLKRVRKDTNPYDIIRLSLRNHRPTIKSEIKRFTDAEEAFLRSFSSRARFRKLILASPTQLEAFKNSATTQLYREDGTRKLNAFGKFLFEAFGYDDFFRTKAKKGLWLASQLNIKSCPYCNEQYTLSVNTKSKKTKALFQFDHFIGKKDFPHLSLSLYNLIPSCAVCNQIKSNSDSPISDYYHPYHLNIAGVSKFQLVQKKPYKLPKDISEKDLEIRFVKSDNDFEDIVNNHERRFEINARYDRHRDVVKDIMVQSVVHNSAFKKDILKIKSLFNGDDSQYKRYVLGNYSEEEEILNRPLAKLTQDIASDLKLI